MRNPYRSIDELYLFPRYQTREDYRNAMREEAAPFDPRRAPKYWFDPNAANSPRRTVIYDPVLAFSSTGVALAGPDGKPMLDVLALSREEAATVNIPPGGTNVPGADVPEIPFPLRQLGPNEELCFQFGGVVAVKDIEIARTTEVGFTYEDREILLAIARKLGILGI